MLAAVAGMSAFLPCRYLKTFFLCFADAPRIILAPKDMKVVEKGIVSFFCKASGNPAPDVTWRRNGKRISANRQRYVLRFFFLLRIPDYLSFTTSVSIL